MTVEPTTEEGSEGVNNVFTRTLAIQLAETAKDIVPKLEGGEVIISQENLRNNVNFELRNITPTIISNVKSEISIKNEEKKTPILEQTKDQLSFAPNSKFNLMTEWNKQFNPGKYTYNINLTDGKGNKWSFAKNFKIKAEVAEKLNKSSVYKKEKFIEKYFMYIVTILTILFIVLLWLIVSRFFKKSK
ncbi:DUF3324 domain-containing protein [Enterococcus mundtii]|uniref:DUF3324 domain-containing protein n=2 Tax=Enterococcus mundtii TaxID=53346 RepID=UPI0020CD7B8E|nr:DUF3324 domain-containing protein [Enterococcus mundtii]MDB7088604.1 DUF3324 domain-containing protein [Enterococcus mundtii]